MTNRHINTRTDTNLLVMVDTVTKLLKSKKYPRIQVHHLKDQLFDKFASHYVTSSVARCVELGLLVFVSFDDLNSLCTPELVSQHYGRHEGMHIVPYSGAITKRVIWYLIQIIEEIVTGSNFTVPHLYESLQARHLLVNYSRDRVSEIINKAILFGDLKEIEPNVYSLSDLYKDRGLFLWKENEIVQNSAKFINDNKRVSHPNVDYPHYFLSKDDGEETEIEENNFWEDETETDNETSEVLPEVTTKKTESDINKENPPLEIQNDVVPFTEDTVSVLDGQDVEDIVIVEETSASPINVPSPVLSSPPILQNQQKQVPKKANLVPKVALTEAEAEKAAFRESLLRQARLPKCYICRESALSTKARPLKYPNIHCTKCDTPAHFSCLRLNKSTGVRMGMNRQWRCTRCESPCTVCSYLKQGESLSRRDFSIQCGSCRRAYHTFCIDLAGRDSTEWDCPSCWSNENIFRHRDVEHNFNYNTQHSQIGPNIVELPDSRLISHQPSLEFHSLFRKKSAFAIKDNFIMWVHRELASSIKDDLTPLYRLPNQIYAWTPQDVCTFVGVLGWPKVGQYLADQSVDGVALLMLRLEDIINRLLPDPFAAQKLHIALARLDQDFLN